MPRSCEGEPEAPSHPQCGVHVHTELQHQQHQQQHWALSTRNRALPSLRANNCVDGAAQASVVRSRDVRRTVPRRLRQLLVLLLVVLLLGWGAVYDGVGRMPFTADPSHATVPPPILSNRPQATETSSPSAAITAVVTTRPTDSVTVTLPHETKDGLTTLETAAALPDATARFTTTATPLTTAPRKQLFPALVPPRLPSSWAQGGGSVKVHRAFTVLTVAPGLPLTTQSTDETARAKDARGKFVALLRRAAHGLCSAGLTRHDTLHEWLLVHNTVVSGTASATAAAVVREWWLGDGCPDERAGRSLVHVAGLPHASSGRPHANTAAAALLYGIRLVETTYVILHSLSRVLFTAPVTQLSPTQQLQQYRALDAVAASSALHEITVALQTLSQNDFPNVSHVVIDDTPVALAASAEVHAFRLQLYVSAALRDAAREENLQSQLVAYVRRVTQPSLADTTVAPAVESSTVAVSSSTPGVQDGLPVAVYSASPHFHCQRAPLYNTRVVVPPWMRAAAHRRTTTTSTAPDAPLQEANSAFTSASVPPPPPLSTLCEVMLSRHSKLPVGYVHDDLAFHRSFCQDWLQFTLLPSPVKPSVDEDVPANLPQGMLNRAARQRENKNNNAGDDAAVQQMDMAQGLGDGICTAEWVGHLRAAQQWYAEQAERRPRGLPAAATSTTAGHVVSNVAGVSPYLDHYAALLFSDNTTQLSRLAGTYLAFLPNTTHALLRLRRTMTEKLRLVSLKHAAERTRRHKTHKRATDSEVVCIPSHLARVDTQSTMYDTQWLLSQLVLRCLQHRERCLGGFGETDARVWLNIERYLSTTGKWSRGAYRVCLSTGVYVADPSLLLPL